MSDTVYRHKIRICKRGHELSPEQPRCLACKRWHDRIRKRRVRQSKTEVVSLCYRVIPISKVPPRQVTVEKQGWKRLMLFLMLLNPKEDAVKLRLGRLTFEPGTIYKAGRRVGIRFCYTVSQGWLYLFNIRKIRQKQ